MHECSGRYNPAQRMLPPQESLSAYDAPVRQAELRLIIKFELAFSKGAPEFEFAGQTHQHRLSKGVTEKAVTGPPLRFGVVQCQVRIGEQLFGRVAVIWADRNSDAH